MKIVRIKSGREKSIRQRHPWVFSGGIAELPKCALGEVVQVLDSKGAYLATGYCNPKSQIQVRLLSWDEDELIDPSFVHQKIEQAWARKNHLLKMTNAVRVIHGESDGIPGLILDLYNDVAVAQFLTAGVDVMRPWIIESIQSILKVKTFVDRSDESVRDLEGLPQRSEIVFGSVDRPVEIQEYGMRLLVDVIHGHKTGYYLDQRDNRHYIRQIAKNRTVLNCFSYTGGFGVSAAIGGAESVTHLDASESALAIARQHHELNQCKAPEVICGDAFEELRVLHKGGRKFDVIVMDPPKLASTKAQVDRACRGYKDLNLLAFKLLNDGGYLLTYSCSGLIGSDLFQKIIFSAALDAKADARIIKYLSQSEDHPTSVYFPEGMYLKGLVLRKS